MMADSFDDAGGEGLGPTVSFKDDPLRHTRQLYEEYGTHNKSFQADIDENFEFCYGKDRNVEKRENDPDVELSAIHINEVFPAFQTVYSSIQSAIDNDSTPIKLISQAKNKKVNTDFDKIEEQLNDEARSCGLLTNKLRHLFLGCVNQPLVASMIGWDKTHGPVWESTDVDKAYYDAGIQDSPARLRYKVISEGPTYDVLNWNQFLYDPRAKDVQHGRGIILSQYMPWHEVEEEAYRLGFTKAAMKRLKAMGPNEDEYHGGDNQGDVTEAYDDDRYRQGAFLINQMWLPMVNKNGQRWIHHYAVGNDKVPMFREYHGRKSLLGRIEYPFEVMRMNQRFNEPEGVPLVRMSMPLGRLLSACLNLFVDAFGYGIVPVTLLSDKDEMNQKLKHGLGKIWYLKEPEKAQKLQSQLGDLGILNIMIEVIRGWIRQLWNAPDTSQGIGGNEQEKATKTLERVKGTATRSRSVFKVVGDFIAGSAQKMIYLHQANGDPAFFQDVTVDVPALTNVYPADLERDIIGSLLQWAEQSPLFQTPIGQIKYRNMAEYYMKKYQLTKYIPSILPSKEELEVMNPDSIMIERMAKKVHDYRESKNQLESDKAPMPEGDAIMEGGNEGTVNSLTNT